LRQAAKSRRNPIVQTRLLSGDISLRDQTPGEVLAHTIDLLSPVHDRMKEPRRLGPRYARCMATVPQLVVRTIPQIINARMGKAA
jgi:hypothetical protein